MSNNPAAWFEIYVDEMKRAKKFYESVLAISLEKLNDPTDSGIEMWSFPSNMEKYGATGALVKMDGFAAVEVIAPWSTFLVMTVQLKNPELKVQAEKFKKRRCQLGSTASFL